jgi:hypothetical protein
MAKANFSRAEDAFSDTLKAMEKKELLNQADIAEGKAIVSGSERLERIRIAKALKGNLKRAHQQDHELYHKLQQSKKEVARLLDDPVGLTGEEWVQVLSLKTKLEEYTKKLPAQASDEQLVAGERKRHINKRLNVSDRWLPL